MSFDFVFALVMFSDIWLDEDSFVNRCFIVALRYPFHSISSDSFEVSLKDWVMLVCAQFTQSDNCETIQFRRRCTIFEQPGTMRVCRF